MEKSLHTLRQVIERALMDQDLKAGWDTSVSIFADAIRDRKKILIAGNGGSAAEAQHFSAEIVGRYKKERRGYPAIALSTDTSILTAVGNDYDFDTVFERQIDAHGSEGDVLVVISSSGNSENCLRAIKAAKARGLTTIALTGRSGGLMKGMCDAELIVPSEDGPSVQEMHLLIVHAWCEHIEAMLV
jgi:D-sedoheptulose 7-phosphate isomerase